jgi:hypothetical protein
MNRFLPLIITIMLAASVCLGQEKPMRVGEVEFFGYAGVDLDKVRAALPFHEGDDISREAWAEKQEHARQALKLVTGNAPTEVAAFCCDERKNLIVFIGLSGRPVRYLPAPEGTARLPASVIHLYGQFLNALEEATLKGASTENGSKGYALSEYAPLRAVQLKMRAYAVRHEGLLRDVLETSAADQQRIVASELLGYARQSGSQVAALARASRDADAEVRNNATRALVVIAASSPELARQIPPEGFIEMLLSGTWTDVNKAGFLLSDLTKSRDAVLLARLRQPEILERLIEIARWRTGHATGARFLLGRIAGIEEDRLGQLVAAGQADVIIGALHGTR